MTLPRLYQFDLPYLKQTGHPFPELGASATPRHVLDIASGRGEWAIAAAQAAPYLRITGIDADEQQVQQARTAANAAGVTNVTFSAMNPFERLNLDEQSFELVNVRYVVGLLPVSSWSGMLHECVRVTQPGGIVRLTETEMPITSSAAAEQLSIWIAQAYARKQLCFSPGERFLGATAPLKRLLQDAGCQEVQQAVWHINFSAGMPAYLEVCQALAQIYQLLVPFLVSCQVAPQEEIEQAYQNMLTEMRSEQFSAGAFSMTAWGTRPGNL